jgi:plastocyanin
MKSIVCRIDDAGTGRVIAYRRRKHCVRNSLKTARIARQFEGTALARASLAGSREGSAMQKAGLAALAFAAALLAANCGGGGSSYGGTSTPTAPTSGGGGGGNATTVTITITGQGGKLAFSPNPASVSMGQLVVFKNTDTITHHIVLDDGSIQTSDIAPGATSAAVAMGTSGSQSYHCTIHPTMVGGFNGTNVDPPPGCGQAYCFGGG